MGACSLYQTASTDNGIKKILWFSIFFLYYHIFGFAEKINLKPGVFLLSFSMLLFRSCKQASNASLQPWKSILSECESSLWKKPIKDWEKPLRYGKQGTWITIPIRMVFHSVSGFSSAASWAFSKVSAVTQCSWSWCHGRWELVHKRPWHQLQPRAKPAADTV